MSNNYFIFDEFKCVGCEACVVACILENDITFPYKWRSIFTSNTNSLPGLPVFNLSLACNHCDKAPCMAGCPSKAITKNDRTGAVIINGNHCLGCRYCTWTCPYEAPIYNNDSRIVEKCNYCNSRLIDNVKPACSTGCPTGALDFSFESINKLENQPTSVEENPEPSVVLENMGVRTGMIIDESLFEKVDYSSVTSPKVKSITVFGELPLLIFTTIASLLIAIAATPLLEIMDHNFSIAIIAAGIASSLISILHLGKINRFWRSVINIRNSWLSREILFFLMFILLVSIDLYTATIPKFVIVMFGLATLLSIDNIYKPLQFDWKSQWHFGQTLIISLSFFLIINYYFWLFAVFVLIRITLFTLNLSSQKFKITNTIWLISMSTIGLFVYMDYNLWIVIIIALIGETSARVSFYDSLDIQRINIKNTRYSK